MFDIFLLLIAAAGQLGLAYLGVKVSAIPPKTIEELRVIKWAFIVVGIIGFSAIIWGGIRSSDVQQTIADGVAKLGKVRVPDASEIANEMKGTKSICYWYANLDAPRDSEGGFQRIVTNTGATISDVRWWVYPLGADQFSDEYRNSRYANLSAAVKCFATGFAIHAPTIKPGKYGIDFTGSNDSGWHELLTITETEKEITEEMIITKDGKGEVLKNSWHKSK